MADQYFYGTGRRKTAVARVRLYPGNGAVVINGKPLEEVFSRDSHRAEVLAPWPGWAARAALALRSNAKAAASAVGRAPSRWASPARSSPATPA